METPGEIFRKELAVLQNNQLHPYQDKHEERLGIIPDSTH
jgi:hypothetical protein